MHFIFPHNVYVTADALLCSVSSLDEQLNNFAAGRCKTLTHLDFSNSQ